MAWKVLSDSNDLHDLIKKSNQEPQIIFKSSPTCSISKIAEMRLQAADQDDLQDYTIGEVNVVDNRPLSMTIAEQFKIEHQSPQVLIIHNEECIYDASHLDIRPDLIIENLIESNEK